MSTIKLYCNDISVYAASIKIALNYKGIAFEAVPPPGGYASPEYKAIVPTGKIPAIVHNDFILSESAAVLEYLQDSFPDPPLRFDEDPVRNAVMRYAQRVHDLYLEPIVRSLFPHMNPNNRDMAIVHAKHADILAQLADLEKNCDSVGPFYIGEHMSLVDCVLPSTLLLADMMYEEFIGAAINYDAFPKLSRARQVHATEDSVLRVVQVLQHANRQWIEKMKALKV